MKVGTPGFNGARLREAREARGLTAVSLADLVGVSRQAISQYERGDLSPQPENLQRMAAVLNMPVVFFLQPSRVSQDDPVFFRSLSGASKSARLAAERRLAWVGDIVDRLEAFVDFPAVHFPKLATRPESGLDNPVIEEAATNLRGEWGVGEGPIHDVVRLIEVKGGIVTRAEAESPAIDAFSTRLTEKHRPCVFLGLEKGSAVRSRFDAVHEVGHMVIHQSVSRKQVSSTAQLRQIEAEANMFASAFLLPAHSFSEDLYIPTLDGLRMLKPKWKVSIAAMVHRASDLGIVSESHARRLWINRSSRKWNRWEPMDDELPLEEPTLLPQAFELVVESGAQSAGQLFDSIPFSPEDVRKLARLPEHFIGDAPPPLRLRPRQELPQAAGGTLVPFGKRPS